MAEENIKTNVSDVKEDKMVEISSNDIQVMANIIDVATQRGGFRAPELKGVGEFYEKLISLIPKDINK